MAPWVENKAMGHPILEWTYGPHFHTQGQTAENCASVDTTCSVNIGQRVELIYRGMAQTFPGG